MQSPPPKPGRAVWLVPVGLIVLSAIPVLGGATRLVDLAGGGPIMPDNARFLAAPVPVIAHILSATLFCLLGAVQLASPLRARWPAWHRAAGRIIVPAGLVAALSGLWMTLAYPPVDGDGPILFGLRLVFGSVMALALVLGWRAIRRDAVAVHAAWIIRGYAIGLGAGTQVFTLLAGALALGAPGELARAGLMGAGWAINLAVAEAIIAVKLTSRAPRLTRGGRIPRALG
jgi:uncharacterized membrane protein